MPKKVEVGEIHKKIWGDGAPSGADNSNKWWEEKGKLASFKPPKPLDTRTRKKTGKTAAASTLSKMIMVLCPVCEITYILTGEDRFNYLRKLERKEMKYGRPCSKECSNKMRIPQVRAKMIDVSTFYKNL